MKTFGWICFWLGIAILIIGLPLVLIFESVLIGKVLVASGINLGIGWKLAHPKKKHIQKLGTNLYCINCGNQRLQRDNFCSSCGVQLIGDKHG